MTADLNKVNALQLVYTKPVPVYRGVDQATIEADFPAVEIGSEAFAILEETRGVFKASGWDWSGGGGGGTWGSITGTLSDQTDLQTALDAKENLSNKATDFSTVNHTLYPTVQAAKTYIDNSVVGLLEMKGDTDCSSNPNYPAGVVGDAYYVTVAGKIGGASGKSVDVGDVYVCKAINAGGTEASVGTSWFVLEHNLQGALLAANNFSDVANPSTALTNLGGTTVGKNIFTLPNPSAIRFIRINADNSVSARTASEMVSDIGAQPSDSDLTAIAALTPSNDDFIQRKAGAWTNRTPAQVIQDLLVLQVNTEDIFRCDSPGGTSLFTATIATLPGGGTTLTYTPVSGSEGCLVPTSTAQLGKLRLYNTTRGTNALISNCNVGTNTITFVTAVPSGSVVGDTISIVSQTVSGGTTNWIDIELTDSGLLNKSALYLFVSMTHGTVGNFFRTHPTETFATSKIVGTNSQEAAVAINQTYFIKLNSNLFSIAWQNAPTTVICRLAGYLP